VVGDLLNHDDALRATSGTSAAYFCYPVRPGLIQATPYFADAVKRAGLGIIVNMSQISAREDSKSHAARDHWVAERVFDWAGVATTHLRPTFFSQWLLYGSFRRTIVEQGVINLPYGDGRHAPIALMETTVTPLTTFEGRIQAVQSKLKQLKSLVQDPQA
jgi:NAD(P)H dehydrogenase (quinone)